MSREIKFRAWEKKVGRMHTVMRINWTDVVDVGLLFHGVQVTHPTPDGEVGMHFQAHEVELMQFTGLLDKNGVEIYEGDIVAIDLWHGNEHGYIPEDGVIQWHEGSCAFKWFGGDKSDLNNYWLSQADEKQREVIGNVYQDKELLK